MCRIQEADAKLKKDKEAAAKKLQEDKAQEDKAADERLQASQSDPAKPAVTATEQAGPASQPAAGTQPPAASAVVSNEVSGPSQAP